MASDFNFSKIEEKILKFWEDRNIFERTLENRKDAKHFVFFEGPPTANGLPAMHHLIGRVYKDLFIRYKTMRGFLVERRAGWDTHGLPVEIEVEKQLGLKNKKEIEEYGIAEFNKKARENVWKYKDEWERFTKRIGFWLDLGNPYITYDSKYIETLWWIIQQINKKGLLYEGHKVLPWCPRCGTALSSHEVAQGYQDVTETSVYVKFKVKNPQAHQLPENTYILAWTTTPWTLPGNVALAVGKKIKYRVTQIKKSNKVEYVIAAADPSIEPRLFEDYLGEEVNFLESIVEGKDLVGLEYEPLFDIPALKNDKSYKVYPADFVTTEDGTGIVHTAVMYGEDDYELGKKIGLPKHHTVDAQGRFTEDVKNFKGQYVKDAEKPIIEYLQTKGLLFKSEAYTHSYPFCWRCKTALLYYARDSWFVAMSTLRKQLIKNNKKVNWVPEHLRDGRFGEFIKEAKDWAFSRERYWGTPLPVWQCTKCKEQKVIGSFDELEKHRYHAKNTYIIMRHGLTARGENMEGKIIISSKLENDHYDLLPKGISDIEKVAEDIRAEGLPGQGGVDLVYASPFIRTHHTARIIAEKLGLRVHLDERLKELDHGLVCEDKSESLCLAPEGQKFDTKLGDGESWNDLRVRMSSFITEIDKKHEGKKILIVSHGDPLWVLEGIALNLSDEEMIEHKNELYLLKSQHKKIHFKNYPDNERGDLDPHRPYIDDIYLKCEKCEDKMTRVKEVVDVWFDSGCMPFAQWHYPFENEKEFSRNFPADFISEAIDQTRGWFYTLLAVSTLLGRGAAYKNVISYSHVLDEKGKKMSKSLGNVVNPWDIIDQFGVDSARWYFYTVNSPGDPKLFSVNDVKKKMTGFVMTLFNSLHFLELYDKPGRAAKSKVKPEAVLDRWIFSKLNNLTQSVTKSLDDYNFTLASRNIESFVVNDLSNWWIRRSRGRFQKPKSAKELESTLDFLRDVLLELSKLMAPFMPFMADHIYKKINNKKESVHLEDWAKAKKKFIDPGLEKAMDELRSFVASGLAQRKAKGIKVRQPLAGVKIKRSERFDAGLEKLIIEELNIKGVYYDAQQSEEVIIDETLTQELIMEGYVREIMRQIQDMRKEAGYRLDEKVFAAWASDSRDVVIAIENFGKEIAEDAMLSQFNHGHQLTEVFDVEKEFELSPQIKIWLGVRDK